jgi:hypothetical protein
MLRWREERLHNYFCRNSVAMADHLGYDIVNPGPGYANSSHLSGDCCINQSKFERPPCSPYGPFTLNSCTFHVSKIMPTCCQNISKIQGGIVRCAPCQFITKCYKSVNLIFFNSHIIISQNRS